VSAEAHEQHHTQQPALPDRPLNEGVGERLARKLTCFTGSTPAVLLALGCVLAWAAVGPWFGYSEEWQLVINTGTTIITFLMVFLIQRAQNKDSLAIHLKLDELVAAHRGASNRLVSAEDLSEVELTALRRDYRRMVNRARAEADPGSKHSIDESALAESRSRDTGDVQ
jgi:low affinity Fe/Cu permease